MITPAEEVRQRVIEYYDTTEARLADYRALDDEAKVEASIEAHAHNFPPILVRGPFTDRAKIIAECTAAGWVTADLDCDSGFVLYPPRTWKQW